MKRWNDEKRRSKNQLLEASNLVSEYKETQFLCKKVESRDAFSNVSLYDSRGFFDQAPNGATYELNVANRSHAL